MQIFINVILEIFEILCIIVYLFVIFAEPIINRVYIES